MTNQQRRNVGIDIPRFVDVQPDYTARTEVGDIVAALTALS
jgi:hypothetical protein